MRQRALVATDEVGPQGEPPASVTIAPDPRAIADFLHDESKIAASAAASVAVPASVDELRRAMRWHAERGHTIVVSGSRTGVAGGGVPIGGEHLVSTSRLRGVVRVDEAADTPTATVLAGTWLSELEAHLVARPGLSFPLDPTERSASLGGMVATNAGGARSFRFGATRDWVEGLTVELASGRTLRLRRGVDRADWNVLSLRDGDEERRVALDAIPKPATKNAVGYAFTPGGDVLDLFVGAEGTLGVVSEVTVRLVRMRESRMGILQFFPDVAAAFHFVDLLRAERGMRTTAIEFLDARSHELARESGKAAAARVLAAAPEGACSIFAEIAYDGDMELAAIAERLEALVRETGGDVQASVGGTSEDELRDIRAFRHAVPEQINAIVARRRDAVPRLHKLATDMAVGDADLAWVHSLYATRLSAAGLDFAIFGHAGSNHFHVNILPRDEDELARAKSLYVGIAREIVGRGGSVAAEHGIGRIKRAFLAVQYPADVLATMRRVKTLFDPEWRLSPGVLLDRED